MEKITYEPLIAHLRDNPDSYNQLFREAEIKYGTINRQYLHHWIVGLVEPVIKHLTQQQTDHLPALFKVFYTELLRLLGSRQGIIHEQEYRAAWLLCCHIPQAMHSTPSKMLKAINSALVSIRMHQPDKVTKWIKLMDATMPRCQSIEDFLHCGRVVAWCCGLAYLRAKAQESYLVISPALQQCLKQHYIAPIPLEQAFSMTWDDVNYPLFMGEVGGFTAFGGPFSAPPFLAMVNGYIIATDKKNSVALFADRFGKTLLTDIPVAPEKVVQNASTHALSQIISKYGNKLLPYNDISSCVLQNTTFVFTRHSSYYLFIYGWS